jgi:hypothetical protein
MTLMTTRRPVQNLTCAWVMSMPRRVPGTPIFRET